jgi:phosphoglycolate phosphatase-like HAD superfamily hydrolase
VWDWNGTLLADVAVVVAATNAVFASVGGPQITVDEHRRGFRRPIADYYAEVLGRPVDPDEFTRFNKLFHDAYQAGLAGCQLTADAEAALRAWPDSQSLLSMWFHDDLHATVAAHGLTDRFIRIDGVPRPLGGVIAHKAPYLAEHLAALQLDGPRVVLIGDTVDDAAAAAAVGAGCVLYSGGFTEPEQLRATGAPVAGSLVEAVRLATGLSRSRFVHGFTNVYPEHDAL